MIPDIDVKSSSEVEKEQVLLEVSLTPVQGDSGGCMSKLAATGAGVFQVGTCLSIPATFSHKLGGALEERASHKRTRVLKAH